MTQISLGLSQSKNPESEYEYIQIPTGIYLIQYSDKKDIYLTLSQEEEQLQQPQFSLDCIPVISFAPNINNNNIIINKPSQTNKTKNQFLFKEKIDDECYQINNLFYDNFDYFL